MLKLYPKMINPPMCHHGPSNFRSSRSLQYMLADVVPHDNDCVNCNYYTKLVRHLGNVYYSNKLSEIPVLLQNEEQLTGDDTECFRWSIQKFLEKRQYMYPYKTLATLLLYRHVLPDQQQVQKTQILGKVINNTLSKMNSEDLYESIRAYISITLSNSYVMEDVFCQWESLPCLQLLIKLWFCGRFLDNGEFEDYTNFVNNNNEYFTSISDKVKEHGESSRSYTLVEHLDERKQLYYTLFKLIYKVLSVNQSDLKPDIFLEQLQHFSGQFSDKNFFSVYILFLERCDFTNVSSIWKLVDNLKSVSSNHSEEFDLCINYFLKKVLCYEKVKELCVIVNDNTESFLAMVDAVKHKTHSDEKQTVYKVVLNLLQYMISIEQTGDKISVILGSLQKYPDDFCDDDFWNVYKGYLQKCDTTQLLTALKLTDTLKSASSTHAEKFVFYLIYLCQRLLQNENIKDLCVFLNENTERFLSMMEAVKKKNQSDDKQTMYEVVLHVLEEMISTEQTKDKMSVILGSLQQYPDDLYDEDFWEVFKIYLQKCALTKFSFVLKLIENLKSVSSTQSEEFDFYLIYFFKRFNWHENVEEFCVIVNYNTESFLSMMDAVTNKKNNSYDKQTMYEVAFYLLQYMIDIDQTDDRMTVILESLQQYSDDFCDKYFWEGYYSYLQRCNIKSSSVCTLLDNLKSVSPARSEKFDLCIIYYLQKWLQNENTKKRCVMVNYNTQSSLSMMATVTNKTHSDEKQTMYKGMLNLFQCVISKDQTDGKMSVILRLLQQYSDDFCDTDFWEAYKSYLQRCVLTELSSVWKLIDNLKSVSPTQSEEFDFYIINFLKRLLQCGNVKEICVVVNDNTESFLSIMNAVKHKNRSDDKQTMYKVVLHVLQYMISTEHADGKMSVILGLLQQYSDDFFDEEFWETFQDYLQSCDITKLSYMQKLIDNLKSVSSTWKVEFDFHNIYFLKKLPWDGNFEVIGAFANDNTETFLSLMKTVKNKNHDNTETFLSMMKTVKNKNHSDEKQTMYTVVLYLLQYKISTDQTDHKMTVILESLQELSDDFHDNEFWKILKSYLQKWNTTKFSKEKQTTYKVLLHLQQYMISSEETSVTIYFLFKSLLKQSNEELWEDFKSYLQNNDLNKLSFILKLTDHAKSVSSTHTEEVDIYFKQIVKRLHHEIKNGQMSSYDTEDFESFISLMGLVKNMKSNEKRILCEVLFRLLQAASEDTFMEISVIVRPLQKLSDSFFDEEFWEVYRRHLLGFDLQKMSSLSKFTCVFKKAHPARSNDFDLYLFYILEKLYYETNKPGTFVNTNLSYFIKMVEKVKKTKKAYKTLCPVIMNLLKSWISSKQFQDKMVTLSCDFSKDFLNAIQSNPLKHYKKKMSPLMRLIYTFQQQANKRRPQIGEMGKRSNLSTLLMLVILLIISTLGHKSAQLKQWLSLKYEYDDAILYLLWCSGDIEIHPGPPTKKDLPIHTSAKERKWIQGISSTLLKLYREKIHSTSKKLWTEKPEDWLPSKPFYDTKNKSKDENGDVITDEELFLCIIECCEKKSVCIPIQCQYEITAWKEKKAWLLFKLHTYRTETETIKSAIVNLLTVSNDTCSLIQTLNSKDLNISLNVESGIMLTKNQIDRRAKNQTEIVADITRAIATLICKILKGKDPEKKCDGIWGESPEGWPHNIAFFNPYNRRKYKHKQQLSENSQAILPKICSDKELAETFLSHRNAIIPQKYEELVETYRKMVKSKDSKKHREALCRIYETLNNVTKLDFALQYLHEEGLLKQEVHDLLHQWWTTQQVDNSEIGKMSKSQKCTHERPEILIKITKDSIKLSTKPCDQICQAKRTVEYTIPVILNFTPVNNQPSTSTSHKSHDYQQNQTEYGSNQQCTTSQSGTICLKGSQTGVSSDQPLNQNSTHDQSDLKSDGKLLQSTEETSNTQGVCSSDTLQNKAKPKRTGNLTKPGKYKSKKISPTVLLIKKRPVQKSSNCHNKYKDPSTDEKVCGLVLNSTSTDDLQHKPGTSVPKIDYVNDGLVTNSLTTDDVSHKLVTTAPTKDDADDGLVTNFHKIDDANHKRVTTAPTTDDVSHKLVTTAPTTDDVEHEPDTSSATIGDNQLISKPKKRKSTTDENSSCNNKRRRRDKDKMAIDSILPSSKKTLCLDSDNMDDATVDIKSVDFLDVNMADLLLTNDNQSKLKDSDELCMDIWSCKHLDSEQCKNTSESNENKELERSFRQIFNGDDTNVNTVTLQ